MTTAMLRYALALSFSALVFLPFPAHAACTSPAGVAGQLALVGGVVKACDGTNWGGGGGSSQWTTSGSDIYYSTGNVSIGTSTPTQALTLNGNLALVGTNRRIMGDFSNATHASRTLFQTSTTNGSSIVGIIPNGTGTTTALNIYNNSDITAALGMGQFSVSTAAVNINSTVLNSGTQLPLGFLIGNVEKMRVDTTGFVGIGTTTPNPLGAVSTVYGNVVTIANTTAGARALLELWTNAAPTSGQTIGQINFLSGTSISGSTPAAAILSTSNGTTANTGDLRFYTASTTGGLAQRMGIDFSGNVGIGTGSPAYTTEIAASAANPTMALHYTGAAAAGGKGALFFTHNRSSDSTQELLSYIQGIAENNQSNGGMRFVSRNNADVEVMRITSAGGLAIGTTGGSERLDVVGTSGNWTAHFWDATAQAHAYFAHPSYGVYGTNAGSGVVGVFGQVTGGGGGQGVYGLSANAASYGLLGNNTATGYYCYLGGPSYSITCNGPTSGVSDERLKKDIKPLEENEGLAAIMKIEPVHYRWKDERMNVAHPNGEIGFLAQNVEAVLPVLVGTSKQDKGASIKLADGKIKSLQYERLTAPLIKAVQQLKHLFDSNDDRLAKLKANYEKLGAEFEAYKKAHP